jgi:cytochrome c peroxidase
VTRLKSITRWVILSVTVVILAAVGHVFAQQPATQTQAQTAAPNPYLEGTAGLDQGPRGLTSYMPVAITETFAQIRARLSGEKAAVEQEHNAVLNERYDLSNRPAQGITMDRVKPIQEGVRVKLPAGVTWESLAAMSPDQIRDQNLYPKGFYPLPHPKHQEGGFVFPHFVIDAIKQQDGRDLQRFDIDFDFPDHFLAEFPPAMYLTPRTDLGDVSQGKLVSLTNYYQMFNGILTPRQLEGLRLLLTPFPEQQFNATEDRRAELPSQGAACFDCHSTATRMARRTRLPMHARSGSAIASKRFRCAA